jgi:hypothetical protein
MTRESDYQLMASLARTDESGGLAKDRAVLLLWFLRHSVGLDDLDAYDFVCDGDKDAGIDGLYIEKSAIGEDCETLVIFQSKYSQAPSEAGPRVVKEFVGTAHHFTDVDSLRELLAQGIEPRLAGLIDELEIERKLAEGWLSDGRLRIRLGLVTSGFLGTNGGNVVKATNREKGAGYLTVYDIDWLGPLANAVASRSLLKATISVSANRTDFTVFGSTPNRVVITAVRADDIATDRRSNPLRSQCPSGASTQLSQAGIGPGDQDSGGPFELPRISQWADSRVRADHHRAGSHRYPESIGRQRGSIGDRLQTRPQ